MPISNLEDSDDIEVIDLTDSPEKSRPIVRYVSRACTTVIISQDAQNSAPVLRVTRMPIASRRLFPSSGLVLTTLPEVTSNSCSTVHLANQEVSIIQDSIANTIPTPDSARDETVLPILEQNQESQSQRNESQTLSNCLTDKPTKSAQDLIIFLPENQTEISNCSPTALVSSRSSTYQLKKDSQSLSGFRCSKTVIEESVSPLPDILEPTTHSGQISFNKLLTDQLIEDAKSQSDVKCSESSTTTNLHSKDSLFPEAELVQENTTTNEINQNSDSVSIFLPLTSAVHEPEITLIHLDQSSASETNLHILVSDQDTTSCIPVNLEESLSLPIMTNQPDPVLQSNSCAVIHEPEITLTHLEPSSASETSLHIPVSVQDTSYIPINLSMPIKTNQRDPVLQSNSFKVTLTVQPESSPQDLSNETQSHIQINTPTEHSLTDGLSTISTPNNLEETDNSMKENVPTSPCSALKKVRTKISENLKSLVILSPSNTFNEHSTISSDRIEQNISSQVHSLVQIGRECRASPNALKCGDCLFTTLSPGRLINHTIEVHGVRVFACSKCDFSADSAVTIMEHNYENHLSAS